MSNTPFGYAESLRIGTVDYVSPDEIKVAIDVEAPESVALNAGAPQPFPRVNGYVLIPVDDGFLVGQIEWLTVERSPFPKRRGMQDFGLVDLPYPLRRMSLNPLGTLRKKSSVPEDYLFRRGADALPSIGAAVLIPTEKQLRSIVESGERRRVKIGTSPLAGNAEVCVDPDRLFGRHLAILGNTGSGKSCSVAGLIRWSLDQAQKQAGQIPNARFVVLDPNGEYAKAFSDVGRIFQVNAQSNSLKVPLWFWNSAEWCAFTQARPGAQAPLLKRALRAMRNEEFEIREDATLSAKRFVGVILQTTISCKNSGEPFRPFPHAKNFTERLAIWNTSIEEYGSRIDYDLNPLSGVVSGLVAQHRIPKNAGTFIDYPIYASSEIDGLIEALRGVHTGLGGTPNDLLPKSEDIPVRFPAQVFVDFLEGLAQETGNEQYLEFLLARIRTMLADSKMTTIIDESNTPTLEEWLIEYIGGDDKNQGCVAVVDLSLVPTEIIHIVTAVIARITFEALQRYRKLNETCLPTVLVMEEAHTFVKRYKEDAENHDAAGVCCRVFERIAREGRKFGLGLVLSSQRPSELSPTVLSQCNTFLLHRISNDRDQELLHRLVPDNLKGLLRELPSLPSQHAILLGWASELPILVKVSNLPDSQQPRSDDPDFWDVWTGKNFAGEPVERKADWKTIADDWQGNRDICQPETGPTPEEPPEEDDIQTLR
jgi:hypothetical protein